MNKRKLQNRECKKIKDKKYLLNNQNAITLIALVISIIVMLILAGVSLNATIGENGIMTQAKNATYMQGIATLEEFLQQKYVEEYEKYNGNEDKIGNMIDLHPEWFYIPANEGVGVLKYIPDSDGNALYLIKKSGLPDEIKSVLRDGNAKDGSYQYYAKLYDVYGVTTDLKVYYCSNSKDSILGITKEQLDNDNPFRVIFTKEKNGNMYSLLEKFDVADENGDKDGILTAKEIRNVKSIDIDENSGISNFSDFSNFSSLNELNLKNLILDDLSGIRNIVQLKKIKIENCVINNFSEISYLGSRLETLIIYNTNNNQFEKLCKSMENVEFPYLSEVRVKNSGNNLTNVSSMNEWENVTKLAINIIDLSNNSITDVSMLKDFNNVNELYLTSNKIETLYEACQNMNNLTKLYVDDNLLKDGKNQALGSLKGKNSLDEVNLMNNKELQYLEGLSTHTSIYNLFKLVGCTNLLTSQVALIADIYNNAYAPYRNIESKYKKYLSTDSILDYSDMNLNDDSDEIKYLKNMSTENKNKVIAIRIQNNPNLTDTVLNEILSQFPNLLSINLNGCSNLTKLDFVNNTPKLVEILFKDTNVIGDEVGKLENCTTIKGIECNNPKIDITKMQKTLSRLRRDFKTSCAYYSLGGMRIGNLASQLSQCTEITFIELTGLVYEGTIDLSNCSKSVSFGMPESQSYTIVLPKNVTYIRFARTVFDLKNCEKIEAVVIENADINVFANFCVQANKYNVKINSFRNVYGDWNSSTKSNYNKNGIDARNLTPSMCINLLANLGIKDIGIGLWQNMSTYSFKTWKDSYKVAQNESYKNCFDDLDFSTGFEGLEIFQTYNATIDNLNFLKNCKNLKVIHCQSANISDITGIKELKNLQTVNLKDSAVSETISFKELINLENLNLENNNIYDADSYIDNGEIVQYKTLEVLANLNKIGKLRYVYLDGNKAITDWTALSRISNWSEYSGW